MKNNFAEANSAKQDHLPSNDLLNGDHRERRRIEMKRRLMVLQSRRVNLERELERVKTCLFALDKQMQNNANLEKLSHRINSNY